ncbi:hypothetical protein DFH07DRAFT_785843 [Mycena maculata]|uniref:Uncharacterized protein n=1 Tax=Mycena maculata TaxID=230809 RepID=A0AAD7H726_9AGAR|nr:hypothetical protein DFH07DRAFT_785843 [Mycena maculata]
MLSPSEKLPHPSRRSSSDRQRGTKDAAPGETASHAPSNAGVAGPVPSHRRSLAKQGPAVLAKALASANTATAEDTTVPGASDMAAPPTSVPAPAPVGDPPKKRKPGCPKNEASLSRTASTSSITEKPPAKNSVAYGLACLEQVRTEMKALIEGINKKVSNANIKAETCRLELRTMAQKLDQLEGELRALREERQNIFDDTGSESGESPVHVSGNKRTVASPRANAKVKRSHPTADPEEGEYSEGEHTAHNARTAVPLKQRMSDAPAPRHGQRGENLPPPFTAPALDAAAPASACPRAAPSAGKIPPVSPAFRDYMRPNQEMDSGFRSSSRSESHLASSRGDRGRAAASRGQGTGKGKDKDRRQRDASYHHGDLPPPFHIPVPNANLQGEVAEVRIRPIVWGPRSHETLQWFCHHIETDQCGPAPDPNWVDNPDVDGFAVAHFVGRGSHAAAADLTDVWNRWVHRRGNQYNATSATLL